MKNKKDLIDISWMEKLLGNLNEIINIETTDGIEREGRFSGVELRKIRYDKKDVEILVGLQLNGDTYDVVPIDRIGSLEIVS
jgi:hypothetical protein